MAPHVGFDADTIKEKARRDLLTLLEGVSKAYQNPFAAWRWLVRSTNGWPRSEERRISYLKKPWLVQLATS